MNDATPQPWPDYTPEQKAAIFEAMKKTFTADDLYGYIEDTDEKFPAAQVLAEAEELVHRLRVAKQGRQG